MNPDDDFEAPPEEPRGVPGSSARGIPEGPPPDDDTEYTDPLEVA